MTSLVDGLGAIHDFCRIAFDDQSQEDVVILDVLQDKIEKAVQASIINPQVGTNLIKQLSSFEGRRIEDLTDAEKDKIKNVFKITDDGYGSQESAAAADPILESIRSNIGGSRKTASFKIKEHLRTGVVQQADGLEEPQEVKKTRINTRTYRLDLGPNPLLTQPLSTEEFQLVEIGSAGVAVPKLFYVDNIRDQRSGYASFTIGEHEPVVIEHEADASGVIAQARILAKQVASHPRYAETIQHAILMLASQHSGNISLPPLRAVLTSMLLDNDLGEKAEIVMGTLQCSVMQGTQQGTGIMGKVFRKRTSESDTLDVRIQADMHVKPKIPRGTSDELKQQLRSSSDMQPVASGCADVTFKYVYNPEASVFTPTDIKTDYTIDHK